MTNLDNAKNTNINDLLKQIGAVEIQKGNSNQTWYLSPFRDETVPSFVVNNSKNLWYDHGEGIGGNSIDFYMKYFLVDFKTALQRMNNGRLPSYGHIRSASNRPIKKKGVDIISINPLNDKYLLKYISKRQIDISLARKYCNEALIRFPNSKNPELEYKVISFENILGGFEFRNETIKLGNTPKGITLIDANPVELNLFEGFFDFLSALQYFKKDTPSFDTMVLNSLSFIEKANEYDVINLYIDHGTAAEKAITKLTSKIKDNRYIFKGYSDFNDLLTRTV